MTNTTQRNEGKMLEALVQNYGFKRTSYDKLPTIDFTYPDFTANGNSEDFRFSRELRNKLRERASIVRENLSGKDMVWTLDSQIMYEIAKITPRLGLEEQMSGKINSIYSYSPLLFVGQNGNDFTAYVVRPIIDASMAWFELTTQEQTQVKEMLKKKAEAMPYKTFFQRIFSRGKK